MENPPVTTFEQHIKNMMTAVETMTQAQINACAYCMGGGGAEWTKTRLLSELQRELDIKGGKPKFKEMMG